MAENTAFDPQSLWSLSYGLYIVAAAHEQGRSCQIANTAVQVTAEPNRIAVALNKLNYTHELADASGAFSVSILERDAPMEFIGLTGFKSGRELDKLARIEHETGVTGSPCVVQRSLAVIEARVFARLDLGTHTIFVGDCVAGRTLKQGEPLTYAYYLQVRKGRASKNAPAYRGEAAESGVDGSHRCAVCGYVYDPAKGDPDHGVAPGTAFEEISADWVCPVCGADKSRFEPV